MTKSQLVQKVSVTLCASMLALIIGELSPEYQVPARAIGLAGVAASVLMVLK